MDRLKHLLFSCILILSSTAALAAVSPPYSPLEHTCLSGDPGFLCLGVKYVVYSDNSSKPVVSAQTVEKNIDAINRIWKQCRIGFQVDEFRVESPASHGLPPATANFSDLDEIREAFGDSSSLLVVTTYPWRRDGNLGRTPANAWTKMPGSGNYGVILEQKVGNFPNIIAHELGHYLNLYHASDNADVMNAIIYNHSNVITPEQCSVARSSVQKYWVNMVRRLPELPAPAPREINRSPAQLATHHGVPSSKS